MMFSDVIGSTSVAVVMPEAVDIALDGNRVNGDWGWFGEGGGRECSVEMGTAGGGEGWESLETVRGRRRREE